VKQALSQLFGALWREAQAYLLLYIAMEASLITLAMEASLITLVTQTLNQYKDKFA
jgi:hypothetical protein